MGESTPPQDYWDVQADSFDEQADHCLLDPPVRAAWADLLLPLLPPPPAVVADLGCGTGSVALLQGESGYRVRGLDLSPRMLAIARAKSAEVGVDSEFQVGDAACPRYAPVSFDAVFARHVLWALPDPVAVLGRWLALLRPGAPLILVEGRWRTGAGIRAQDMVAMVRRHRTDVSLRRLDDGALWGGPVDDERYLLVSRG